MRTVKEQIELKNKVLQGLKLAYERMLEFKKQKNSELVVVQDGKIVKIKPWETK